MKTTRRSFIRTGSLAAAAAGIGFSCSGEEGKSDKKEGRSQKKIRRNRIGVSTYSFWQFNGPKENAPIEDCIEKAAAMGFDGIELLHRQMASEDNSYLL